MKLYSNRFAGQIPVHEPCHCGDTRVHSLHRDHQDTAGEAWQRLLALIDAAAADGRETFAPGQEIEPELWQQIVRLPPSIAGLTRVKTLNLYGSNLSAIPPQIGEMMRLETFDPYTSRRLHWFPHEISRCRALRDSTVSTRHLYGNFKNRLAFPRLPAEPPEGTTPPVCSVCAGPFAASGPHQVWISLPIATDVLPLLVHACSSDCVAALPAPPKNYVDHPHHGGSELVQPPGY